MHHPVDQVAGHAAQHEPQRHLPQRRLHPKLTAADPKEHQRHHREDRQPEVVAAKHAPRRTGVAVVDQFKKTVDHNDWRIGAMSRPGDFLHHNPLGDLVQRKRQEPDGEDSKVVDGSLWHDCAHPIWPVSQADGKPSRKTGPNLIEENEIFFVTNQKKPIDYLAL